MTTVLEPASRAQPAVRTGWNRPGLAYLFTVAVGAVTSFALLGRSSLYLDEAVSTTIARAPWHRFTQAILHQESNAALYYFVLRGWMHLGQRETAVRSLSALASVGALAILIYVAHELFGRRVALICGLLLAVDPLVVELAQDARGYALSLLLVSASSALFVRGISRPSGWGTWAGYVIVAALAAYSNFWAALVPLGHAVSLAFLPPGQIQWRRLLPAGFGLAVLLIPLGLMIHSNDSGGKYNWASGTSAGHLFTTVRAKVPHTVIDVAVIVVIVAAVWLVVVLKRRPRTAAVFEQWPLMFTLSWLVVPVAAVVLLSFAYKPLVVVRYLVVFLPPAAMLLGVGLARLSPRMLVAGLAVLIAASGAGLWQWYAHGPGEDWRGAVTTIADRSQPGDGVVVFPAYMRLPFEWYLQGHAAAERRLQSVWPALGWGIDPLHFDTYIRVEANTVAQAAHGHGRVWLVLSQADLYPSQKHAVLGALSAARLRPTHSFAFTGIRVVEYVSPAFAARLLASAPR